MTQHQSEPAPLTPLSMHILLALAEKDLHGYALMQAVREQSGDAVRPGTGSLYAAVQRLVDDGLIRVVASEAEDSRRGNAYRLTPEGQRSAAAEAKRMRGVLNLAADRNIVPARKGA
jgi:DNA-binding PadR family transcriptional regulator